MQTINQIYSNQIELKKSTFLAFLCPFSDFKNLLKDLKKQHPKAVHFVWAYRNLNTQMQIIEDKNDDKEPKATAGLPSLNVLRGYELINVAVIIVRYFGGIKLGTGGLVRAYTKAVSGVVLSANLLNYTFKKTLKIHADLKAFGKIEHFLKTHNFEFQKDFQENKVLIFLKLNPQEQELFTKFTSSFSPKQLLVCK